MEEFFPQNENLKTVLCRPSVEKSQNCEIFFWGYDGRTITRAEFTGMTTNFPFGQLHLSVVFQDLKAGFKYDLIQCYYGLKV